MRGRGEGTACKYIFHVFNTYSMYLTRNVNRFAEFEGGVCGGGGGGARGFLIQSYPMYLTKKVNRFVECNRGVKGRVARKEGVRVGGGGGSLIGGS